ncbi:MAG: hypothetical protein JWP97_2527 [Labilithrix sp.]|nr:hypothetical protein [Labilithrix sp.]
MPTLARSAGALARAAASPRWSARATAPPTMSVTGAANTMAYMRLLTHAVAFAYPMTDVTSAQTSRPVHSPTSARQARFQVRTRAPSGTRIMNGANVKRRAKASFSRAGSTWCFASIVTV